MNIANFTKHFDEAERDYNSRINFLCGVLNDTVIKPYCDRYELKFWAAQGRFYFERRDHEILSCFYDNGPGDYKEIYQLLSKKIIGGASIGSKCYNCP